MTTFIGDDDLDVAEEVDSGRRVASQRHRCLLEVWKRPGRTAAEVARAAGLRRHAPSRRLPDLRRNGLVRNGERRACAVTGNPCMTWFPPSPLVQKTKAET
jgi:CRP-like cAMP-binding protein